MPEFRRDPVIGRWVIISSERGKRPYDFISQPEEVKKAGCPFCGGFESKTPPEVFAYRDPGTDPNTEGWQVRVVENKFPALVNTGDADKNETGLYQSMNGIGAHEIFIETPEHAMEIDDLPVEHVGLIFKAYRERMLFNQEDPRLRYVLIFKNVGQKAGASLSHSHSQLVATPMIPKRIQEEMNGARDYFYKEHSCVFCDIVSRELEAKERVVWQTENFVAICPYASRFPFEMWVLPKYHSAHYYQSTDAQLAELGELCQYVLGKLSKALKKPQYNYMLHTAPVRYREEGYGNAVEKDFHWHLEIIPRLTHVAGFEWGTGFYINPTSPEMSAQFLRE
ncbi:MAG: galactose-1-phosphate uridylyltransferase [Fibrobacteria bacterium]|nr:galactose-1-phosphate uridylyltransferase [Fibrobacteria bacterium]